VKLKLGGGFKYIFFISTPTWGRFPILTNEYFSIGLVQPPTSANIFESNPSEDSVRLDARRCAEDEGLLGWKSSRLSVPEENQLTLVSLEKNN